MGSTHIRFLSWSSCLLGAFLAFQMAAFAQADDQAWKAEGIINTSASPKAKLHSVPIRAVTMGSGIWADRMRTNVEDSIPTLLALLEEHGVVDNFLRLSGQKHVSRRGPLYTDSDLYKWMEAVAFVLQSGDRPQLRQTLDKLIDDVLAAQEPSGYLNTYYVADRAKLRFSEMYRSHELYCLGHLLQAAIAYYRATGDRKLLDGGIKYVDYVLKTLGPEKKPALTGHPEFEMALVELYRTTGDKRYLDFVNYLFTGERMRLQLTDDQARRPCGAGPLRVQRGYGLLPRDGRSGLRRDPRPALEGLGGPENVHYGRRRIVRAGRVSGHGLRPAQRQRLRGKLCGHCQPDVELAHAGSEGSRPLC